MEENDEASKVIKQFGLLSMMSGMDKETMEGITSGLMERIIHRNNTSRIVKFHCRKPSR